MELVVQLSSEFTQDIRVCLKFLDMKLAYTLEKKSEAHNYVFSVYYINA